MTKTFPTADLEKFVLRAELLAMALGIIGVLGILLSLTVYQNPVYTAIGVLFVSLAYVAVFGALHIVASTKISEDSTETILTELKNIRKELAQLKKTLKS